MVFVLRIRRDRIEAVHPSTQENGHQNITWVLALRIDGNIGQRRSFSRGPAYRGQRAAQKYLASRISR
jgi:hypothetical protein